MSPQRHRDTRTQRSGCSTKNEHLISSPAKTLVLVRQRIHYEVNRHAICKAGKIMRIKRVVGVLVRVTEIGVVIDHNHQAPVVIPNAFALRDKTILFPSDPAVVGVCEAWHLDDLVDVIKLMKDGVIAWDVLELHVWEDFSQLPFHSLPLEAAPKVIQNPKAATLEILSHNRSIILRENHLLGLAGINEWVSKEIRIVDRHCPFVICNVEVRQALQAHDQMVVRIRVIGVPVLVVPRYPSVVNQAGEDDLVGVLG